MPDVWATVVELDPGTQASLADVLETRGADPQQQALRTEFLGGIAFRPRARVLEVGCGTGVLTRRLARLPEVASVVGVDVAEVLLARARELAADLPQVSFATGDARSLPFADGAFDAVVLDSTLCHVPGVEAAVGETFRVLSPDGLLAAFDGDYSTVTVALDAHDPLQTCIAAMVDGSVTDRYVMRRLPSLARAAGFVGVAVRGHSFVDAEGGTYFRSIVDRSADMLAAAGVVGGETAAALKAEARRR